MIRRNIALLCLCQLFLYSLYADEANDENFNRILKEAVTIKIDSKIIKIDGEVNWQSDIEKVTVPGRAVALKFESENQKLIIKLTPFRMDDGSYLLTALTNLWIKKESGAKFRSSYKTIMLKKEELVLFYPLGMDAQKALTGGNIYLELGIIITPYISPLEEQTE